MSGKERLWKQSVRDILVRAAQLQQEALGKDTTAGLSGDGGIRPLKDTGDVIAKIDALAHSPSMRSFLDISMSPDQLEAAATVVAFRFVFLLGNPGTGKTKLATFLYFLVWAIEACGAGATDDSKRPKWVTPLNRGRTVMEGAATLHFLLNQTPETMKSVSSSVSGLPFQDLDANVRRLGLKPGKLAGFTGTIFCDEAAYAPLDLLVMTMFFAAKAGGGWFGFGDMQQIMPIGANPDISSEEAVRDNRIYIVQTELARSVGMRVACLETLHRTRGVATELTRSLSSYCDDPIAVPWSDVPLRPSEILSARIINEEQAADLIRNHRVVFICVRKSDVDAWKAKVRIVRDNPAYEHKPVFRCGKRAIPNPPSRATTRYPLLELGEGDPVVFTCTATVKSEDGSTSLNVYNGLEATVAKIFCDKAKKIVRIVVKVGGSRYSVTAITRPAEAELFAGTVHTGKPVLVEFFPLNCTTAVTVHSLQGLQFGIDEFGVETKVVIVTSTSNADHSGPLYVAATRARELDQISIIATKAFGIGPHYLSSAVDAVIRRLSRERLPLSSLSPKQLSAEIYAHATRLSAENARVRVVPPTANSRSFLSARSVHHITLPDEAPADTLQESSPKRRRGNTDKQSPSDRPQSSAVLNRDVLAPGRVYLP